MDTRQEFAYYPLTLFDGVIEVGIVTGWLVEGLLDVGKIEQALNRVVAKWPMLSGRLESTGVCASQFRSASIILTIIACEEISAQN